MDRNGNVNVSGIDVERNRPSAETTEGGEARASSPSENSSEGENRDKGISEYEKQRLCRIRENRARLEALGLPHLSSSLLGPSSKRQYPRKEGKAKKKAKQRKGFGGIGADDEEDEEYRPSDEDDGEDEDRESCSASEDEEERSRRKGKKKSFSNAGKVRKSLYEKGNMKESDYIDDDTALQQAIALSLGGATDQTVSDGVSQNSSCTNVADASAPVKKDRGNIQENAGRRKSRKVNKSRVQLTEDEVVAYFFSFDVAGKGHITVRDLQRMVIAHDFSWTDMEIASMIHSFDSDRDGKLSLEDFRSIVSLCNMIQEPGKC